MKCESAAEPSLASLLLAARRKHGGSVDGVRSTEHLRQSNPQPREHLRKISCPTAARALACRSLRRPHLVVLGQAIAEWQAPWRLRSDSAPNCRCSSRAKSRSGVGSLDLRTDHHRPAAHRAMDFDLRFPTCRAADAREWFLSHERDARGVQMPLIRAAVDGSVDSRSSPLSDCQLPTVNRQLANFVPSGSGACAVHLACRKATHIAAPEPIARNLDLGEWLK